MQGLLFDEPYLPGQRLLERHQLALASKGKFEAEYKLKGEKGNKLAKLVKKAMANIVNSEDDLTSSELNDYDVIYIGFSGGKDSVACVLNLLKMGVEPSKIELHHHDIDGRESDTFMDWECTRGYCQRFAEDLGLKIYFSWKKGGFEREMLRENSRTAPVRYEVPIDGGIKILESGGTGGKENTRRKFPQVSADLSTRWCSSYLKIGVCSSSISGQDRFNGKSVLLITGERAEESPNRALYYKFEAHSANAPTKSRTVHQYRMVHAWTTEDVWEIMQEFSIDPHPAYKLNLGRCSCMGCIFGNADQWAMIQSIEPERFEKIAQYEEEFGFTIQRDKSVRELAETGSFTVNDPELVKLATSKHYNQPVVIDKSKWELPIGAYAEGCGPT